MVSYNIMLVSFMLHLEKLGLSHHGPFPYSFLVHAHGLPDNIQVSEKIKCVTEIKHRSKRIE